MADSIVQTEKECWFCGARAGLEEHHIFAGVANRKISEKYGLTDPKDAGKIRAAIKKAILARYGIKDLHDVPAIARQAVEAQISRWADIRCIYRIRDSHRTGGD